MPGRRCLDLIDGIHIVHASQTERGRAGNKGLCGDKSIAKEKFPLYRSSVREGIDSQEVELVLGQVCLGGSPRFHLNPVVVFLLESAWKRVEGAVLVVGFPAAEEVKADVETGLFFTMPNCLLGFVANPPPVAHVTVA